MFHAPMKNLAKTADELKDDMPMIARVASAAERPIKRAVLQAPMRQRVTY